MLELAEGFGMFSVCLALVMEKPQQSLGPCQDSTCPSCPWPSTRGHLAAWQASLEFRFRQGSQVLAFDRKNGSGPKLHQRRWVGHWEKFLQKKGCPALALVE